MTTQRVAPYEGVIAEMVPFQGHHGDIIYGYFARPLGPGPYPGVVNIIEVFGLLPHIKELTLKIAARGFVVLAPDLHFREGPGSPEDVAAKVRAEGGVPDDRFVGDMEGAVRYLRSLPSCNGKVGAIGYCSGGRHSWIAACNISSLNAAVVCYGGRIVATPDQLTPRQPVAAIDMTPRLNCPLLGLFGAEDGNPNPEMVRRMEEELRRLGKSFEFHTYQNAGHGFFADYRPSYRQEAAVDGWNRVFAFFDRHLTS
jgi:carboxymethylenebutenolidase